VAWCCARGPKPDLWLEQLGGDASIQGIVNSIEGFLLDYLDQDQEKSLTASAAGHWRHQDASGTSSGSSSQAGRD
jgi:hypothetical protein